MQMTSPVTHLISLVILHLDLLKYGDKCVTLTHSSLLASIPEQIPDYPSPVIHFFDETRQQSIIQT